MDVLDYIRDLFSRDCEIGTVQHLVMAEFGLSEEDANSKIKEYFEIINAIDRSRRQENSKNNCADTH